MVSVTVSKLGCIELFSSSQGFLLTANTTVSSAEEADGASRALHCRQHVCVLGCKAGRTGAPQSSDSTAPSKRNIAFFSPDQWPPNSAECGPKPSQLPNLRIDAESNSNLTQRLIDRWASASQFTIIHETSSTKLLINEESGYVHARRRNDIILNVW